MARYAKPLIALVPLLLFLALAAAPAAAQAPPTDPRPQPDPNQPAREVCVPAGLALAVIAESGTVAEILPPERTSLDPALDPVSKVTVKAPAAVGACATFEGFWGEAAGGREHARLMLHSLANADDPALATPIARDAVTESRRGPSRHQAQLRAISTFDKPGVYRLAAQLVVEAGQPDAAGLVGSSVSDQHRFVFTVEVVDSQEPPPNPAPTAYGAVSGRVTDMAGDPVAGAVVTVATGSNVRPIPAENWSTAPRTVRAVPMAGGTGAIALPVSSATSPQQARHAARTGPDGHYALRLPVGRYFVRAEARGFVGEWFDDESAITDARPVPVRDGEETPGIDFALRAAAAPDPQPNPNDFATIKGTVTRADGSPIASARVMAARAADALPSNPNVPPGQNLRGIVASTDREGRFELRVPPETYVVAALGAMTASGRHVAVQYYDHQERVQDAEQLELHAGDVQESVDFTIAQP